MAYAIDQLTDAVKGLPYILYYRASTQAAAGWTLQSYGTGTAGSYSSTGAGWGLASISTNTRAWYRIQDPAGLREEVIQVQVGSPNWFTARIKYSASAKFTGGSPDAQTTPTAADERVLYGAGTDASPTYVAISANSGAVARVHTYAPSSPVNGVYPVYCFAHRNGGTTLDHWSFHDPLLTGSFNALDPEPLVQYWSASLGGQVLFHTGYGTGSQAAQTMTLPTSQSGFDGARSVEPISGNDTPGRIAYYGASGPPKGYSYGVLCKGQPRAFNNYGDDGVDNYVYLSTAAAGNMCRFQVGVVPGL